MKDKNNRNKKDSIISSVRDLCGKVGLRVCAKRAQVDASHLSLVINGDRKASASMLFSLREVLADDGRN